MNTTPVSAGAGRKVNWTGCLLCSPVPMHDTVSAIVRCLKPPPPKELRESLPPEERGAHLNEQQASCRSVADRRTSEISNFAFNNKEFGVPHWKCQRGGSNPAVSLA
jgi:hypothetical protein